MTSRVANQAGRKGHYGQQVDRILLSFSCPLLAIHLFYIFGFIKRLPIGYFKVAFKTSDFEVPSYNYLALGLISIMSILGHIGVITRNKRFLQLFGLTVILMAANEGFDSYKAYMDRNDDILLKWKDYLKNYDWNQTERSIYPWDSKPGDAFQEWFKCCGLTGPSDWSESRPKNISQDLLPSSCCPGASSHTVIGRCYIDDAYETGCELQYHKEENSLILYHAMICVYYFVLAVLAFNLACSQRGPVYQAASQCD